MEIEKFYFASQDLGSIVHLEHVNLAAPDTIVAMVFYIEGLGFTRDPFNTSSTTLWVNIGTQQIHVPTLETPQVLSGHIGLLIPNLDQLVMRLQKIQDHSLLSGTKFSWKIKDKAKNGLVPEQYTDKVVHVQCPWGNKFRIYQASQHFGKKEIGILYVLQNCEKKKLWEPWHNFIKHTLRCLYLSWNHKKWLKL